MKVLIIQRAKAISSPSLLSKQLSSLLGDKNVCEAKASPTNMLSLREHTLRLRRQWLSFKEDGVQQNHIIASGLECEIVKLWLFMYPTDFQSATFINDIGIKKSLSVKSLPYYFIVYWNMIFNKQQVTEKPLLLLGNSNKTDADRNSDHSHVSYMKNQSSSDLLEENDPQWVANQVYTWIHREENTL